MILQKHNRLYNLLFTSRETILLVQLPFKLSKTKAHKSLSISILLYQFSFPNFSNGEILNEALKCFRLEMRYICHRYYLLELVQFNSSIRLPGTLPITA